MATSTAPLVGLDADPHVFLIGRPPLEEFLGFVTSVVVGGDTADVGKLADDWRTANDHVQHLRVAEPAYADDAAVRDLPPALEDLARATLSDRVVQDSFAIVPIEIRMVELDRLVVWQKKINLTHVQRLRARIGTAPSDEDIYDLCLPSFAGREDAAVQSNQVGQNVFGFVSHSNDLRLLGVRLLEGTALEDVSFGGIATKVIAVAVGFGSNLLTAISANGRLVLNNGSHRAYALREAGFTHAPCLIQRVTREDELSAIASGGLAQSPALYFNAPRPPVLKDYFDERLRMIAQVPRAARQVRVAVNVEAMDVPVAA